MSLSVSNLTRSKSPVGDLLLSSIADKILGKKFDLSLVFIGNKFSQKLNKEHRGKDKPTNVLSFELSKTSGEIFMNLSLAKKEAPKFNRSYSNFVTFLFIHSAHHLKGMQHGSRMDEAEEKIRKVFKI